MFRIKSLWEKFWMQFSGISAFGRAATWLATLFSPTYFGRHHLAHIHRRGYISPRSIIHHADLKLGANIFIDDNVIIYQYNRGGTVSISDSSSLHRDCILQTGNNGSISIGSNTHIQPRCIFSAFVSPIIVGSNVQIAPNCFFYSYNHAFSPDDLIMNQPLQSKGGIVIEDDTWIGVNVIVLDGVKIGKGAVIGAGSVVTHDIPDNTIAFGVPAKIVRLRSDLLQERENNERF